MRILHVVTLGPSDGGGIPGPLRVALSQCASLNQAGDQAEVWTTTTTGQAESLVLRGVQVRVFRARQLSHRSLSTIFSPQLLKALRVEASRFGLIQLHLGRDLVMLPGAYLLKAKRRRYVTQTHGMIEPGHSFLRRCFDLVITRPALSSAKRCFALQRVEAQWLKECGVDRAKIAVIPNAVDVPPTSPSEVASGRDEVLFLAHLRPRKNVMLFYAASLIAAQRSPTTVFTIAGPDGGDLPRLHAALAENRCRWPDPVRWKCFV